MQFFQRFRRPDIAITRPDHNHDSVRAKQLGAILEKRIGVFMALRQLLVEAGRHVQARGENAHDNSQQQEQQQGCRAIAEEEIFQAFYENNDARHRIKPLMSCCKTNMALQWLGGPLYGTGRTAL